MICIAFDLETTGLINPDVDDPIYQPGIVQFGAVKWTETQGGRHMEPSRREWLINPEKLIEPDAFKTHGIAQDQVDSKPTLIGQFHEISEFFTGVGRLVTFNGPGYDLPVLMFNLRRYGLQYRFPWPRLQMDVMVAATEYMGMQSKSGNKFPKLTELYEFLFKKPLEGAHGALADAEATMKCFRELQNRRVI